MNAELLEKIIRIKQYELLAILNNVEATMEKQEEKKED